MKKNINIIFVLLICIQLIGVTVHAVDENVEGTENNILTEQLITESEEYLQNDIYNEENSLEYTTEYIPVTDVIVSEFDDDMYIKETQNINVTVLPDTANNSKVAYSSSNNSVATIDPLGKVTAIGKGTCYVNVQADGVITSLNLKVKVKTETILADKTFVVLKENETINLNAHVKPSNADQKLTYKSIDEEIITVGEDGTITAKKSGSTSLIISNNDFMISISIVVNGMAFSDTPDQEIKENINIKGESNLIERIRNSKEDIISVKNLKYIDSDILKQMYGTSKCLITEYEDYNLKICGSDIKNASNEMNTELTFKETKDGVLVTVNNNNKLPGKIEVELKNNKYIYSYIYMLDERDNKYKVLDIEKSKNVFEIDSVGTYLLSDEKKTEFRFNLFFVLSFVGIILVLTIVYIFTKKKYWFW